MKRWLWVVMIVLVPVISLAQVEFAATILDPEFDGALNVAAADLDGDGDMDIVGAAESGDEFAWWEQTAEGWTYHFLADRYWATGLDVGDIDNDGDIDIAGAPVTVDDVCWFENDGSGNFTVHDITTWGGARGLVLEDMNDDGYLDMVLCKDSTSDVVWLQYSGSPTEWSLHVLPEFEGAYDVAAGDINGDGYVDIAVGGGDLGWFESTEDGWELHVLSATYSSCRSVELADMDNDGDLDIASTSRNDYVTWWQNNGATWQQLDIDTTFDGADDCYPADIDDDGDMDLVACAVTADEVVWYEQVTGGDWDSHIIDPALNYASGVTVADIDDDGDMDVIGAGYYTDRIVLYEQLGTPGPVSFTLTPIQTVVPETGGTVTFSAELVSSLGTTFNNVAFWRTYILPNTQEIGPFSYYPFTLTPFMNATVPLSETVPATAPAGTYTLIGHVGYIGNPDLQIEDSFTFTKEGETVAGAFFDPADWVASEVSFEQDSGQTLLAQTSVLTTVSPNPFNAATNIAVTLPARENVKLQIVNPLGQQVEEVYAGALTAGQHVFSFDATGYASGIYFLVGSVGQTPVSQKLVVLK